MSMLKILIVVTNVNAYASGNLETGLWLSELTHIYHAAKEKGYVPISMQMKQLLCMLHREHFMQSCNLYVAA